MLLGYLSIDPKPFEAMGQGVAKRAPQCFYVSLAPNPIPFEAWGKESQNEPLGAFILVWFQPPYTTTES
jgi:hypothetical protein